MAVTARQLHPIFFAEISGFDIAKPLSADDARDVRAAMDKYAACVFRGGHVTDEQHIEFSRIFGPLSLAPKDVGRTSKRRLRYQELFDAGNLDENGVIYAANDLRRTYGKGNRLWHTDASFNKVRGAYSLLAAHVVPDQGADTEFADMRAAYDDLPQTMKNKIENLVAEHSVWHSRQLAGYPEPTQEELTARPPAKHKLVHVHPTSGRKTLYIAAHVSDISGWPRDEGRALLAELMAHATQEKYVHAHKWEVGDIVIWDNLCTMHRATPFEDMDTPRDLRRTTAHEVIAA
jgi:alpha-ketoglutarate-dependent 2,4-dichlorophenoxyacetate dioxygenase